MCKVVVNFLTEVQPYLNVKNQQQNTVPFSDAIARFSNQLSHAVFASRQLVCLKIQESKLHPLMQKEFFCGLSEKNETRMLTCKKLEVLVYIHEGTCHLAFTDKAGDK